MNLFHRRIQNKNRASSALLVVLFAVVLATVIILALLTGAQLEKQSAFYYRERVRADLLAQGGVEHAIGLLRTTMGAIDSTNETVMIAPGRIMYFSDYAGVTTEFGPIELSSGD